MGNFFPFFASCLRILTCLNEMMVIQRSRQAKQEGVLQYIEYFSFVYYHCKKYQELRTTSPKLCCLSIITNRVMWTVWSPVLCGQREERKNRSLRMVRVGDPTRGNTLKINRDRIKTEKKNETKHLSLHLT